MNLPFPVCFGLPGPSRDHITVVVIRFVVRGFRDGRREHRRGDARDASSAAACALEDAPADRWAGGRRRVRAVRRALGAHVPIPPRRQGEQCSPNARRRAVRVSLSHPTARPGVCIWFWTIRLRLLLPLGHPPRCDHFGTVACGMCERSLTCANPADHWFCCDSPNATCPGCREEPHHSTDPFWWRLYEHVAPPLPSNESSEESCSGSDR